MRGPRQIDDRWVRAVGIPGFGVAIPHVTGLFGPFGPRDARYWLGLGWFVLLSGLIWQGNRWLLFKQREHVGWFDQPIRKITVLLAATLFGTAPVTVAMLVAWYRLAGFAVVDWGAVRIVTLANVICVIFITHVYETVFLIREREADLVHVERLEKARIEAELSALRAQVDPHFMFNALNTLSYLIGADPARAREFNERLARVYRYILSQRDRDLVLLREELEFLDDYAGLLRLRFGDEALRLVLGGLDAARDRRVLPPIALQVLLENAVKHNEFSRSLPLEVSFTLHEEAIVVSNPRRPRPLDRPSAGLGLRNLGERYRLATRKEIQVDDGPERFAVTLPLLQV